MISYLKYLSLEGRKIFFTLHILKSGVKWLENKDPFYSALFVLRQGQLSFIKRKLNIFHNANSKIGQKIVGEQEPVLQCNCN